MTKLGYMVNKPPESRAYEASSLLVLPRCYLGLEFEYENVHNPVLPAEYPYNLYTTHEDGSLKNRGREYVFREPLFGADVVRAVQALCRTAQIRGWDPSRRAGIHIHLDVRDLSAQQLGGLCMAYAIAEPALFRWIGQMRSESIYSVPWYASDISLSQAARVVSTAYLGSADAADQEIKSGVVHAANDYDRYAGLNLQSIAKWGTLEFRHMRSTTDADRILNWINLVLNLKRVSEVLPTSDRAALDLMRGLGSARFLQYVFPQMHEMLMYEDWDANFHEQGLVTADSLMAQALAAPVWKSLKLPHGAHKGYARFKLETRGSDPPSQNLVDAMGALAVPLGPPLDDEDGGPEPDPEED